MAVDFCPRGHPTLTSQDRRAGGGCSECHREANRDLRQRNRASLAVVRAFEASGVEFQHDGQPADPVQIIRQLIQLHGMNVT